MSDWEARRAAPPEGIPTGETALRDLAAGKLKPVYFLVGDHAWMQSRIAGQVRDLSVPEEWRSMNAETVWADEVSEARVAEAAATPPFGSPKRFLLVRGVEAYRGGPPSAPAGGGEAGEESAPAAAPVGRECSD